MPDVLTSSSAFRRRRRAGSAQLLRRTTEYDNSNNSTCLLHNSSDDQYDARRGSKRFLKWTACFAFVTKFKRSKSEKLDFISEIEPGRRHSSNINSSNNYRSSSSCPATVDVAQHEKQLLSLSFPSLQQRHTMNNHNRRPFSQYLERAASMDPDQDSIASTLLQWKEGTGSLPVSPLSALSPPPRHAMKERSRSLTAEEDTVPEVPPLPTPRKRKATTISRSLALRLSLDVDQHYYSSSGITHSSSGFSNGTSSDFLRKGDRDDEDDTASSVSSSQPQQQQQRTSSGVNLHNNNNNGTAPELKLRLSSIEPSSTTTLDLHKQQQQQQQQRRQQHRVSPITIPEIDTLKDQQQQEEDDSSDYDDLINEFRLPSEKLPEKQQQSTNNNNNNSNSSNNNDDDNSSTVAVPAVATTTVAEVQKDRETIKEVSSSRHPLDNTQENSNSYYYYYDNNNSNGPPKPFVSRSTITARELSRQKAMEALEGHFAALEPTGSKSMDIVRDKAHYDAVVAGTLHRRPWTQYLRAQPDAKEDEDSSSSPQQQQQQHQTTTMTIDEEKEKKKNARYVKASSAVFAGYNSKLHRPSLVFFPPSPNSINSDY